MDINYEYYKIFYYVAQYENFTLAAEKLYANQPNLTRTIKKLEQSLGVSLFAKRGRNVCLTPEGKELYERISAAMEQIESAERELSSFAALEGGYISVGASEVALHKSLLPALRAYKQAHPKINVLLFNHSSPQAVSTLKNGGCDIAVISVANEFDPALEYTKIGEYSEIPVCAADFPLRKESFTIADLCDFPLISLGRNTASYEAYKFLFQSKQKIFRPEIEVATADQILPIVSYGLGVGLVPDIFLQEQSQESLKKYKKIPLSESLPKRNIYIVRKKRQPLNLATKKLVQILLSSAGIEP